jgi:hypothetical protein
MRSFRSHLGSFSQDEFGLTSIDAALATDGEEGIVGARLGARPELGKNF